MRDAIIFIIIFFLAFCIVLSIILTLYFILRSPFSYPYFFYEFDVSGKRNPHIDDFLDAFLISDRFTSIQSHKEKIEQWKQDCIQRIERSLLKNYRRKQYKRVLNDKATYVFYFTRAQTRYRQRSYIKSAYKVKVQNGTFSYDYDYLQERYNQLANIGFECGLRAYHNKNQRKLATRELREQIMKRDNYTCQICGKYMPDEVGLQVDHIVPVSKGGKTVPSNLRVLCSKCNGSKSDKISF